MTLLFLMRPIYFPTVGDVIATSKAPKKWRKKLKKWFLSMAPSFSGAISENYRQMAQQQQEEAGKIVQRVENRRREAEDAAILMMLEDYGD